MKTATFEVTIDDSITTHLQLAWETGGTVCGLSYDAAIIDWSVALDSPVWGPVILGWVRDEFADQVIDDCIYDHEDGESYIRVDVYTRKLAKVRHVKDVAKLREQLPVGGAA